MKYEDIKNLRRRVDTTLGYENSLTINTLTKIEIINLLVDEIDELRTYIELNLAVSRGEA